MGDADDEQFESTDAGASYSFPQEAGQIRKGGHLMIKGRPTKVIEVTSSKTGKHGHAKCHFVATDIFTGKKMEDLIPASHTAAVPFVKKNEYQCIDVDDDDYVTYLDENSNDKADIQLPHRLNPTPPGADKLSETIKEKLASDVDFYIIVQSACGIVQIIDYKLMTNTS